MATPYTPPFIPVILEDSGLLPSLTHPSHIGLLCSWGFALSSPTRIFNDFGYSITPIIIRLIAEINLQLDRLSVQDEKRQLKLRRINQIRTVQGSLAIEGNTLSEAQITAILEGKRVIAPPKEIQEARNGAMRYKPTRNSTAGSLIMSSIYWLHINC
ncbi:hypothetical protein [Rheinheimera riviphila]|uniref:hypothetical protein n=1 Tax=Rheinheimera riviphila TaxID=1834037 RepID=UPI001F0B9343|nr:hypothetical protein [Rheinheimera riviphila]